MLRKQVKDILAKPEILQAAPHPTIFHELVSGEDGRKIPSQQALEDEAFLMIFAGTDTSSNTLTWATTYILQNPEVYTRLTNELMKAWPSLNDRPRYEDIENLPYLVSCPMLRLLCIDAVIILESCSEGVFTPSTWSDFSNDSYRSWRWRQYRRTLYSAEGVSLL
jgi:hypothetical protein